MDQSDNEAFFDWWMHLQMIEMMMILQKIVRSLHDFSQSHPDPNQWLMKH